jgi:hypothetical protein
MELYNASWEKVIALEEVFSMQNYQNNNYGYQDCTYYEGVCHR